MNKGTMNNEQGHNDTMNNGTMDNEQGIEEKCLS